MQNIYITLLISLFLTHAHACDDTHERDKRHAQGSENFSSSGSLNDTFGLLKKKLGVLVTRKFKDGIPSITSEDIDNLERNLSFAFPHEIRGFFTECGNLRWVIYNFPYAKNPTHSMWSFFNTHCKDDDLIPFCEIPDSSGYYCFDSSSKKVISYFPKGQNLCCHHSDQEWESLQNFLIDYLDLLQRSQFF